jgi:hypothetical protein
MDGQFDFLLNMVMDDWRHAATPHQKGISSLELDGHATRMNLSLCQAAEDLVSSIVAIIYFIMLNLCVVIFKKYNKTRLDRVWDCLHLKQPQWMPILFCITDLNMAVIHGRLVLAAATFS